MRPLSWICRRPSLWVALALSAQPFLTACQNVPGEQAPELEFYAHPAGLLNHILASTTRLGQLQTSTTTLTGETVLHEWRTRDGAPVEKDAVAQVQMCAKRVSAEAPDHREPTTHDLSGYALEKSIWNAFVGCMESQGFKPVQRSMALPSDFRFGLRHRSEYIGSAYLARGKENTLERFKEDLDACAAQIRSGWNGKMKTHTFMPLFTTGTSALSTPAVIETIKTIEPAGRELQQCMEGFGYTVEQWKP